MKSAIGLVAGGIVVAGYGWYKSPSDTEEERSMRLYRTGQEARPFGVYDGVTTLGFILVVAGLCVGAVTALR